MDIPFKEMPSFVTCTAASLFENEPMFLSKKCCTTFSKGTVQNDATFCRVKLCDISSGNQERPWMNQSAYSISKKNLAKFLGFKIQDSERNCDRVLLHLAFFSGTLRPNVSRFPRKRAWYVETMIFFSLKCWCSLGRTADNLVQSPIVTSEAWDCWLYKLYV